MKKIVAFLTAVSMLGVLAACGGQKAPEANAGDAATFGQAAIYSVDLTPLGYDLKVTDGTWQQTFDEVVSLIKKESDPEKRFALIHTAEDLVMSTGALLPLYYYADFYMLKDTVKGFFSSPLGYKFFSDTTVDGKTDKIDVCLASEPDSLDPALNSSSDGGTVDSHLFAGLIKWGQDASGKLVLLPDNARDMPNKTINEDGTVTYTFELRDGLKWSDGSDLTAADYEFSWKRAASEELAADYGYMFDVIDGYADGELNVKADGNKLTVVLTSDIPYFTELCAFFSYFPVKESVVSDESWATDAATYVSNGAYTMQSWDHGSKIVLTKNPAYWDAANVKMEQITFNLTGDDNVMLANYKSGAWQFIDFVPIAEIPTLKKDYPTEFVVTGQLGTYYSSFNINTDLLPASSTLSNTEKAVAMQEIRQALSLLIDRNYLVEEVTKAGEIAASSFVGMGLTEPDGTQFYENAGHSDAYIGYYDVSPEAMQGNIAKAIEMLKKYYAYDEASKTFTDFPPITYIYNTATNHQAFAEYLQGAWAAYGINIKVENQEWNTFLQTRKSGNYDISRNGWFSDYNDPISFIDMWITASGNNDVQFGR